MGGKKPLRRPLWPPTRATASNYYPLGLDGAGGAAKPLLRAPKKPAPLHGRLPAFSGAVDAFERARKCFLEWRYFFSIILSEFLKNRVALHRNRTLPYIAIDVINNIQPDPFLEGLGSEDYSSMGNAPIIEESINGKANNHLFFVIDGTSKIRASESFHEDEAEKAKRTSVMWIRAAKDGKMYLRESACISMPFLVKNIGNGPAKKLRMAFSCQNRTPFFKTEIILEQNKSFYIHIFSEKELDEIKGNYVFSVYYEDISGNIYEQLFPVEIVNENKKWYTRIDTNGEQRLIRRTS